MPQRNPQRRQSASGGADGRVTRFQRQLLGVTNRRPRSVSWHCAHRSSGAGRQANGRTHCVGRPCMHLAVCRGNRALGDVEPNGLSAIAETQARKGDASARRRRRLRTSAPHGTCGGRHVGALLQASLPRSAPQLSSGARSDSGLARSDANPKRGGNAMTSGRSEAKPAGARQGSVGRFLRKSRCRVA